MTDFNEKLYYTVEDVDEILFSKNIIEQIMLYDKTVELVGIVGQAEIRSNLMKFTLHNKGKEIIQVLVWDQEIIEKMKNMIMPGNVLHIDGAFAKHRNVSLSKGNIEYDLHVMCNTAVRVLKEIPNYCTNESTNSQANSPLEIVSIENCVKYSNTIQVIGFIKNVIKEVSLPNTQINQGCISDCMAYKLEVRMPIVCDMTEFGLGDHVKITGVIKFSQHPYIWVLAKSDIVHHSKEKKKINELLKGTKMPKRPLTDYTNLCGSGSPVSPKIMKREKN